MPQGVHLVPVELEEIRRTEGILALAERLELGRPKVFAQRRLRALSARRINAKEEKKRDLMLAAEKLNQLEGEVERLAKRSDERSGREIP